MKEWKVWFTIRNNDGTITEQYMMQDALTIHGALEAAEAKIAKMALHLRAKMYVIWDIGIMDDNVF